MINLKKTIEFLDDDILYYAGSLSFFTILALLPILALIIVLISTLKIFDLYIDKFTLFALDFINPTHSEDLLRNISDFLSNASELGSIGLGYLFFSFILFFRDYDHIVNKIYNIPQKPFLKMFFIYILFILLLPILFAAYTFIIASLNIAFVDNIFAQSTFTLVINWLLFILLFKISINQKIKFNAMAISTFAVLMSLTIFKYLFIYYSIYNQMYSTIYGSFAVLMFFFIWIYVSWLIYLYGVKLSKVLNQRLSRF